MTAPASIREEIVRLQELLKHETHRRRNLEQLVTNLAEEGQDASLAMQELRHQLDTANLHVDELRQRIAALEEKLRTVAAQRAAIIVSVITAVGAVAAAALGLLH